MRPALRKVGSLLLAVVIVISAGPAVGGPVGQAEAAASDCTIEDVALGVLASYLNPEDTCGIYNDKAAKKAHTDAYAHAKTIEQQQNNYLVTAENFRTDRKQPAWTEGKIALVNHLNNNSNLSTTKTAANQSMSAYYRASVNNVVQHMSAASSQAEYQWRANESWVKLSDGEGEIIGWTTVRMPLPGPGNTTARMPVTGTCDNPSTYNPISRGATYWNEDDGLDDEWNDSGESHTSGSLDGITALSIENTNTTCDNLNKQEMGFDTLQDMQIQVTSPNSSETAVVLPGEEYRLHILYTYFDQGDLRDDMGPYVDEVYAEYQAGELSTKEILAPSELASRASSSYNSTGANSFLSIELASLGLGGDFNSSVTIQTTENGTNVTLDGTLFYTGDDVESFQPGTTYSNTSLNGVAYLSVPGDGNGTVKKLDGEWTITSAQNPETGEEVANVSMQSYTKKTTNASDLQAELEKLAELRQQYEEAEAALTIGGGGLPDAPEAPESPLRDIIPALVIGGLILFAVSQRS